MSNKIKLIGEKITQLPSIYKSSLQPFLTSVINKAIVQPGKSLIRLHKLKKTYNPRYSWWVSTSKAFLIAYLIYNYVEYDLSIASLVGRTLQDTEYYKLVRKTIEDSAGSDKIKYETVEMINKGKQKGLLAVQINQLAYLLQPMEIAWQGRYLASLKA